MHILYTYNIGTKKYISMIENTEQLIRELYLDNSIIERSKATIMYYPGIDLIDLQYLFNLFATIILFTIPRYKCSCRSIWRTTRN